jgi:Secretion system C-terminal sorting domain
MVFYVEDQTMTFLRAIFIVFIVSAGLMAAAQARPESAPTDASKQVKLFPNPAIEFLTVKFETAQARKAKLSIHNIIGNELETETEVIDDFEVRVKVKDLSTGFYLLFVKNEETGLKGAYKFLKK